MALMILVLGLIIAVPCQHRIVEAGDSTPRILRVSSRFANYTLSAPRHRPRLRYLRRHSSHDGEPA